RSNYKRYRSSLSQARGDKLVEPGCPLLGLFGVQWVRPIGCRRSGSNPEVAFNHCARQTDPRQPKGFRKAVLRECRDPGNKRRREPNDLIANQNFTLLPPNANRRWIDSGLDPSKLIGERAFLGARV